MNLTAPPFPTDLPWTRFLAHAAKRETLRWTRNRRLAITHESDPDGATVLLVVRGTWRIDGELFTAGKFRQRRLLFLLEPEQILILPHTLLPELHLYATGEPEAEILVLTLAAYLNGQRLGNCSKQIRHSMSEAFIKLSGIERNPLPPTLGRVLNLNPGETRKLRPGQIVLPATEPIWVATSGLNALPPPRTTPLPPFWLLHRDSALRNDSPEALRPTGLTVPQLTKHPDGLAHLSALTRFHWTELVAQWQHRLDEADAEAGSGLARQELQHQSTRGRLLSLLSGKKVHLPLTSNQVLRAAFHLIGRQGWMPVLPRFIDDEQPLPLLKRVAASSGLILREVRLSGTWWQHDHGTLLAFHRDNSPRVLEFRRGRYRCWNPTDESNTRLTDALGAQLQDRAINFFGQLPAQKLSLRDLVTFEAHQVRGEIFALLAIALLGSGLSALLPMASAFVVDSVLPSGLDGLLAVIGGCLLILGVFQVGFSWAQSLLMARLKLRLDLAATVALWHRVLYFPRQVLGSFAAGDIAMRVNSLTGMQQFFQGMTQGAVTMSLQMLTNLGVVIWVNFQLGLAVAGFGLIALLIATGISYWQVRAFAGGEKSLGIVNSYILEIFGGIHKIKAAGAEQACLRQWADRYSRLRTKTRTTAGIGIVHSSVQAAWVTISTGLLYYLIINYPDASFEPARFIAFLGAFSVFSMNLGGLCAILLGVGMQFPMLKFIAPLMDNVPDLRPDRLRPRDLNGRLRVENLSFAYPRQKSLALQGINLDFAPGSFIVVAGASGSGKSTLARLLCGLEPPRSGHVFLDDYELETLDPTVLRQAIAVTPQDYRLLPGSLYENIRGAIAAEREQVVEAAKLACIWDDIEALPMGLHTVTSGESGTFSGGQVQRIAVARALIRKPRILILDEATSALDNTLQARIVANLKQINCTVIFIAHRLNLARTADRIIMLAGGKLAEQGTHAELSEGKGPYARMIGGSAS